MEFALKKYYLQLEISDLAGIGELRHLAREALPE
jgi:hypothetical protein